jgi:rare lipoprotein A
VLRLTLIICTALLLAAAPAGAATLGQRPLKLGKKGPDVVILQRILERKGYAVGGADGIFGRRTKAAVKSFQRRRGLTADGIVGPATTHALALGWRIRTATYYGPGLWGNRTACGWVLRHATLGIAHRTLPCGTQVPVYRDGRIAFFPVIDRGPYTSGVELDLTQAAARTLGMSTTSDVRAGY